MHETPAVKSEALSKWQVCFRGTKCSSVFEIMKQGKLLKPGDATYMGDTLRVLPNHIDAKLKRINQYTKTEETFDPTDKMFFSPSIKYCDYGNVYMTSFKSSRGRMYRLAFQVHCHPFLRRGRS